MIPHQTDSGLGLFSLADGKTGNAYLAPQAGYMYFELQASQEKPTLAEWSDLKKVAGTEYVIAFAQRYEWNGRLRKASDKVESPDVYPVYNGITRVVTGQGLGSIENPESPHNCWRLTRRRLRLDGAM
jgi:hypothetical protein